MLEDSTMTEFLDVLASKAPTPGGGGASAMCGALAASLGQMVGNLTSGKKRYAEVQGRIEEILDELGRLRAKLLVLAAEDATAFKPLAAAYGMPRTTEKERAIKAEVMEKALRVACVPPYKMMETLNKVIDLLDELGHIGSRIALSDVGVGAAFAGAALKGASLNVFINAKSMADREYADDLVARTQALLDEGCKKADDTFQTVMEAVS